MTKLWALKESDRARVCNECYKDATSFCTGYNNLLCLDCFLDEAKRAKHGAGLPAEDGSLADRLLWVDDRFSGYEVGRTELEAIKREFLEALPEDIGPKDITLCDEHADDKVYGEHWVVCVCGLPVAAWFPADGTFQMSSHLSPDAVIRTEESPVRAGYGIDTQREAVVWVLERVRELQMALASGEPLFEGRICSSYLD